jgi:hypothetical protein
MTLGRQASTRGRDNFTKAVRDHLARSVNFHCSKCGAPTSGPYSGGGKSITTGIAAHICAAAPGGPRFDPNMTVAQRRHYDNGIWLCARHGPLVDRDWPRYSVEQLTAIKREAESKAAADLEHVPAQGGVVRSIRGAAKEWGKLTKRFERLEEAAIRASHRLRDSGTQVRAERPDTDEPAAKWEIRSSDRDCQREAELLCGLAGARLLSTGIENTLPSEVRSVQDDIERWLFFLKALGEARLPDMRPYVTTTVEGILHELSYDTIDDLAKASARGCTDCERRASASN